MKRFIFFCMALFISSLYYTAYCQFPVGLYSGEQYNSGSNTPYEILNAGANMLLHNLPSNSALNSVSTYQYNYIIPINAYFAASRALNGASWYDTIGLKTRFGSPMYSSYSAAYTNIKKEAA